MEWGEPGTGPGEFDLLHGIAIDDQRQLGQRRYPHRRLRDQFYVLACRTTSSLAFKGLAG